MTLTDQNQLVSQLFPKAIHLKEEIQIREILQPTKKTISKFKGRCKTLKLIKQLEGTSRNKMFLKTIKIIGLKFLSLIIGLGFHRQEKEHCY
jgi:hypothetical protein